MDGTAAYILDVKLLLLSIVRDYGRTTHPKSSAVLHEGDRPQRWSIREGSKYAQSWWSDSSLQKGSAGILWPSFPCARLDPQCMFPSRRWYSPRMDNRAESRECPSFAPTCCCTPDLLHGYDIVRNGLVGKGCLAGAYGAGRGRRPGVVLMY